MKTTAASLFIIIPAKAFAPASYQFHPVRDAVELHGLRTFWRNRFSRGKQRESDSSVTEEIEFEAFGCPGYPVLETIDSSNDQLQNVPSMPLSTLEVEDPVTVETSVPSVGDDILLSTQMLKKNLEISRPAVEQKEKWGDGTDPSSETSTVAVLTVDENREDELLDVPYTLLPIDDLKLNKLEQEFRDMLLDFSRFTKRDIMAVRNPRVRALFEGVAASYSLPEVYRAFEVLFEDYAPLRIAGRLIYRKLKQVMVDAQLERQKEVEEVAASTGLSKEDIEASRIAFFKVVVHEDDRATEMSIQQLVDYGIAETAAEVLGYDSFGQFVRAIDPKATQTLDFCELMVALQSCAVDSPRPECNSAHVLQEISNRLESREVIDPPSRDKRKMKVNQRYDVMVEKFKEWKDLLPSGDGRRLDILRGCFVGAGSQEIVEALRIVYMDYSALRLSGDLVFKVMEALVQAAQKRQRDFGPT
jgi:hypothetical protein